MKRRVAHLPLHGGQAPAWLFKRMTRLAGAVTMAIVDQFGPEEMLARLADPWWFQAFGCVLGFDWHSSGVTTVTCGALKQAYRQHGRDLGIIVAGGKGGVSRKTPDELARISDEYGINEGDRLIYASRMSAKVDSAAVQDSFDIYHHSFFLTPAGQWCVVQQGMNEQQKAARRYHWLGESVRDFVCEPHAAVRDVDGLFGTGQRGKKPAGGAPRQLLLNMVAEEADANRKASAELIRENPDWLLEQVKRYTEGPTLFAPTRHRVLDLDVSRSRLRKIVVAAHESDPQDFETLLGTKGVGATTVRALSLLAELIYEAPTSRRDPADAKLPGKPGSESTQDRRWADYSYAHGGKDGTPFPVDCATFDRSIEVLNRAVRSARVGDNERVEALQRLARVSRGDDGAA
ncbi:DUF763 domain-containing protein [Maioricimonas sp. JC845]|uniref:DUF763 domain-containing protein n=1 Tax=Maioricimonas sp. JC845 TaxID=3232138 RepID=UPI0034586711